MSITVDIRAEGDPTVILCGEGDDDTVLRVAEGLVTLGETGQTVLIDDGGLALGSGRREEFETFVERRLHEREIAVAWIRSYNDDSLVSSW